MAPRRELRELRTGKGLTQADVADRMGVKRPFVSQLEAGARRPSYDKMLLLAEILGPEVMDIFADESRSAREVA